MAARRQWGLLLHGAEDLACFYAGFRSDLTFPGADMQGCRPAEQGPFPLCWVPSTYCSPLAILPCGCLNVSGTVAHGVGVFHRCPGQRARFESFPHVMWEGSGRSGRRSCEEGRGRSRWCPSSRTPSVQQPNETSDGAHCSLLRPSLRFSSTSLRNPSSRLARPTRDPPPVTRKKEICFRRFQNQLL